VAVNLKGLSPGLADELRKLEKLVNEEMDLDIVEWHFFRHSYMRILANRLRLAERDRGVRLTTLASSSPRRICTSTGNGSPT